MADELLALRGVTKAYGKARVLHGVDLAIARVETIALVGPSGSGKSTLARCAAGLEPPDSGQVVRHCRPEQVQLIFQQPAATLNPRFTAQEILEEPLVIQKRDRAGVAVRSLDLVGITRAALSKRPLEFSGGERQRLAIARALVLDPALLILDESFTGLDWQLQEQIASLVRELNQRLGLAYLLISHDLELAAALAERVAVIAGGAIVEEGPIAAIFSAPKHAVTRELTTAAQTLGVTMGES